MNRDETIKSYMENLGLSLADATQLYEDDLADEIGEEGEMLEEKAKSSRHYEKSTSNKRKESTYVKKVDAEKVELLKVAEKALAEMVESLARKNEDAGLTFKYNGHSYTFTLTKHRK